MITPEQLRSLSSHLRANKSLCTHDLGHRLPEILDECADILDPKVIASVGSVDIPLESFYTDDEAFSKHLNEQLGKAL